MKYDCSDYQCYTAHPKHEHQQNDQRNDHKTNNALLVVEANVSTYANVKKSSHYSWRKDQMSISEQGQLLFLH